MVSRATKMDNYAIQPAFGSVKTVLFFFLVGFAGLSGQDTTATSASQLTPIDYQDTWSSPMILDEMTRDPEQNKSWRMGDYRYSAKPKNSLEFGLHFGHFVIEGDVDKNILGGYGIGFHLRKSLSYALSLRTNLMYGIATGLDKRPTRHRNHFNPNGIGGGLVEDVFDPFDPMRGGPGEWFAAYRTSYVGADISLIFNAGNMLFHRDRNRWNLYVGLGLGLKTSKTRLDMLDSNGLPYDSVRELINWTPEEYATSSGKSRYKEEIQAIYDEDYETEAFQESALFRLGDDNVFHLLITPSIGISRKLNKRFNISLDHAVYFSDDDYLDGKKFRTAVDQSNSIDVGHYTSLRLGINIGDFTTVTEPLYWVNPLDQALNDIANLKNQDRLDLADTDNDGVIDLLDQELDTPEDCPVDTRGILLDSDGDGIADCYDKEPFSRPGCPVDRDGIADCEEDVAALDEARINEILDMRLEEFRNTLPLSTAENIPGTFISNDDGSQTYVTRDKDGAALRITKGTDGSKLTEREYADGTKSSLVEKPDGTKTAEIVTSEGLKIRQQESPDGTRISVEENRDGSTTTRTSFPNGTVESVTTYPDGKKMRILEDTDGVIIRETEYANGDIENTALMPDGTLKSQFRTADKAITNITRDAQGRTEQTTRFPDGSTRKTTMDEDGTIRSVREFTDGRVITRTKAADGTLTEEISYPDGRYRKLTEKSNGEIWLDEVAADGMMTNTKQRADGSQRVVRSTETEILSDEEIPATQAEALSGVQFIPGFMIGEDPVAPAPVILPEAGKLPAQEEAKTETVRVVHSACGDWFLPMIHFDLNRSSIKAQYYSHLHNVAEVMRKCPDICVTAHGHTDTRFNNDYNTVLSYKRAKAAIDYLTDTYDIDRSRLILMYGGEESPMVMSASTEAQHFMNRRVEFRTCEENDREMAVPPAYKPDPVRPAQSADEDMIGKPSGY